MNRSAQVGKYIYSTKAIGKGAFSKVYKGFDTETDEIIAIKIIDKLQLKLELVERLHDEIHLLTQLDHPHIAELKEFLQDEDHFYLILEYCAGGDLAHLIKKGRIPETVAKAYMQQLSSALQYLKDRNIIHRDLKPQNILLSSDYRILKITDFNFARELYDNDLAQTLCGSPLYMAPEIIEKQHYSVKSDLWSVGMILYEMVYGNNPYFDACNVLDLIHKITNRPIQYSNRVSAECNDLLHGLLQRDPHKRFDWDTFFSHSWLQSEIADWAADLQQDSFQNIRNSVDSISAFDSARRSYRADDDSLKRSRGRIYVPQSKPVAITARKVTRTINPDSLYDSQGRTPFRVDVLENYVPMGITPPKHTRSEPVDVYRVHPPKSKGNSIVSLQSFHPSSSNTLGRQQRVSSSAPDSKNVVDSIWSYMSSSAAVLKGAVDYISSTDPRK